MKKIFLPIIVLVVLVGVYFAFSNKEKVTVVPEIVDRKMSFESFLKNDKGSYVCTVAQDVGGTQSSGTVYVSSVIGETRKIRGEFSSTVQGMKIDTNFVMKDGFSYTWGSMMPQMGYKVKVQEQTGDTTTATSGTYSFNASQIGSYNCEDWKADNKMFDLPSSVKFMDIPQTAPVSVEITSTTFIV
jgi:hypothetical protein